MSHTMYNYYYEILIIIIIIYNTYATARLLGLLFALANLAAIFSG